MTEPSTSTACQDHFQAVTDEIRGCDRCYHRFYRLGQIKPELFKVRKKRGKPAKNEKTSSTPSTGGLLLETGELGQRILDLSLQIHESPKINGKKKNKILEDGYLAINGCEQHLENLKNTIEEALIQRVELRIDGIMSGKSEERIAAEDNIKEKYRIRRDRLTKKSQLQVENLRRQLADDIDFEEKDAAVRSEAIKKRRLQEIEGNLKKLGCVGPDFTIPPKQIDLLPSEVFDVHTDGFQGTVVFPINPKDDEKLMELERKELQNFILYARAPVRVGRRRKTAEKHIKLEPVPLNGSLLIGPCNDFE